MPKCPACGEKTQEKWTFCPACGMRLDSSEIVTSSLDRNRYLWERKECGKNIYYNFKIAQNFGKVGYGLKYEPVRKNLGDFENINLLNLRRFSFPYIQPDQIYEIYNIGKLIGYYTVNVAHKEAGLSGLIEKFSKTNMFWKIFDNSFFKQKLNEGWTNVGGATSIKIKEIDKESKR